MENEDEHKMKTRDGARTQMLGPLSYRDEHEAHTWFHTHDLECA